jgi:hypothetical protein
VGPGVTLGDSEGKEGKDGPLENESGKDETDGSFEKYGADDGDSDGPSVSLGKLDGVGVGKG